MRSFSGTASAGSSARSTVGSLSHAGAGRTPSTRLRRSGFRSFGRLPPFALLIHERTTASLHRGAGLQRGRGGRGVLLAHSGCGRVARRRGVRDDLRRRRQSRHVVLAARRAESADERVRVVKFSRNFGHQIAITAGLDHAARRLCGHHRLGPAGPTGGHPTDGGAMEGRV